MVVQNNFKQFKHLNQEKRIEIYKYLDKGLSNRKIGKLIGCHHSTITREINRNGIDYGRGKIKYKPLDAHKRYIKRRFKANRLHTKLIKNHKLRSKIHYLLQKKGTERGPDEILGRLKFEGRKIVSTSTLYRFIRNCTTWSRYLRFKQDGYKYKRRKRGNYEKIKGVKRIKERETIVNKRGRIGDWEVDTVLSCRKGTGGLFTATERKSRYELIKKVGNLKAETLKITMLACFNGETIKTITCDNGSEFCRISHITNKLKIQGYKADPYASYQRGSNERHNGFIRRFIPKKSNINEYSEIEIQKIQNILNHKPRRCLDYRTPYEVYHNKQLTYIT